MIFLNGMASYSDLISFVKAFLLVSLGHYFSSQILLGVLASHCFSMVKIRGIFPFSALEKINQNIYKFYEMLVES